jgi:hypothetical protein
MRHQDHKTMTYSAVAIGGALLWGVIEVVALWRSRWATRATRHRG